MSAELAFTYAALILADEGVEITVSFHFVSSILQGADVSFGIPQADKLTTLTNAAKVEAEPIWATLLAKALEGKDIKDLLT